MDGTTLLPLIGIPIVVIGFALRFNPLLVVVVAGLATGLLVGMDFGMLLETFGEKFVNSRSLATFILILPVIGLLEYYGLKERAQAWVAKIASATSARILMLYFVAREGTAALGLISIAGPAQTVRPLVAPMADAAADVEDRSRGRLDEGRRGAHLLAVRLGHGPIPRQIDAVGPDERRRGRHGVKSGTGGRGRLRL